jgi:uncharacterized damage-inducible protein DinB
MIDARYAAEMAAYNSWQNEVLYALCDDLGETRRREDLGLYFGSIHRTLDHVLAVDDWILDAVDGFRPAPLDVSATRIGEWGQLRAARGATDARIGRLADRDPGWFDEALEVESARLGRTRRIPRALYVVQMFNHQTHHRAQATAALHRLGIEYGATDLPFRPGSPY